MRILITNDDGARADGIKLLEEVARSITDDVWVVAPEFDQSGVSHSISLHEPLRVHQEGERRFLVRGTPADCVVLGVEHLLDRRPDLVLSGVNRGGNMADSIAYSGTVGAAMTALAVGVPAIALSQFFQGVDIHWETARVFAKPLIERLLEIDWERRVAPNVNFPACPPAEVTGVAVCHPGHGFIDGVRVEERVDVRGGSYYWLQFRRAKEPVDDPTCDIAQLWQNKITVTPLRPDRHGEGDWGGFEARFADLLRTGTAPDLS
ncbi:5'/3'-nucleotidase SurE [Acuticoccus mangrovi]|uniref:5'-nucleotidase SurE n=1 Tax=Acuticoccus mangrovi TaxID=2796142 RepID=A0A934IJT1_9HYPH|nr:5'/3'-nucleotidase SurE [Acuticoccus mangrovi]MBJ3775067.1 5'/3'-nucleotidase SurE [Acuticoccus mangrovi]